MGEERPEDPDQSADTLRVPDDISSLTADVVAFRREESARRRRQRWDSATRWFRRLRWYGVSVPVVVAALAVVGGLGAMLVLLGPHGSAPAPVPTKPVSSGHAGDTILPVTLVRADGQRVSTTALTGPAAILLVPAACACTTTIDAVQALATARGLTADVVLTTVAPHGSADLTDVTGALLRTYGGIATAPTLLYLNEYAVIETITVGVNATNAATKVPTP